MSVYDDHIKKVSEYVKKMHQKELSVREFICTGSIEKLKQGLSVKVGPKANTDIILRSDTFMELGNPKIGSKSLFLWTDDPSCIKDGKITLFGPDIQESGGASLPFAQILIVAGENFKEKDQETLEIGSHLSDHVEGYMVKSSTTNLWGRVSKDAALKGFSFETLGKALMVTFKNNVPDTQAMEVIFITSSKEDILQLDVITQKVRDIRRDIVKETWKAKGYDLDCDYDCSSCTDQSVCDDIRDVLKAQKKKKKVEEEVG